MSEDGVSSIAVIEENRGILLSAVSVTDIGKVRALRFAVRPSEAESNKDCCSPPE